MSDWQTLASKGRGREQEMDSAQHGIDKTGQRILLDW